MLALSNADRFTAEGDAQVCILLIQLAVNIIELAIRSHAFVWRENGGHVYQPVDNRSLLGFGAIYQ